MPIKIKPVHHKRGDSNRYCGPSAISAITGMNTGEAARLLRYVSGKASIKGCYTRHVLSALDMCGITYGRQSVTNKPTLAAWLRESKAQRTSGRVFLVVAGHHFQIISGRRYVCGLTGDIVSIKHDKVKRRARVAEVIELFADGRITIPDVARKPAKDRTTSKLRRKCRKIAAEYGFHIDAERGSWGVSYWVSMSDDAEDLAFDKGHELSDGHVCYYWDEVAERLDRMVEFHKAHFAPLPQAA